MLAEAEELENKSFPGVAAFEERRFKTRELWYRLGAAEKAARGGAQQAKRGRRRDSRRWRSARPPLKDEYTRGRGARRRGCGTRSSACGRAPPRSRCSWPRRRCRPRRCARWPSRPFAQAEERKKQVQSLARRGRRPRRPAVDATREKLEATRTRAPPSASAAAPAPTSSTSGTATISGTPTPSRWSTTRRATTSRCSRCRSTRSTAPGAPRSSSRRAPQPLSLEEGDRRFEEYFLKGRRGESRARPGHDQEPPWTRCPCSRVRPCSRCSRTRSSTTSPTCRDRRPCPRGRSIFEEGELGDAVYVIANGEVGGGAPRRRRAQPVTIATLRPGPVLRGDEPDRQGVPLGDGEGEDRLRRCCTSRPRT